MVLNRLLSGGILVVGLSFFSNSEANVRSKVVYGPDNRLDLYQVEDRMLLDLADSTLAHIPSNLISSTNRGTAMIDGRDFKTAYGLCDDEPFKEQKTSADCSAFLVGPDLIATAGHCITNSTCADTSYVFGYSVKEQGRASYEVPSSEAYRCKEVVKRELTREQDYAVVRLDRAVPNHRVLTLAREKAKAGDPLVVIGHPAGLPTKVAGGARVRNVFSGYFNSNLDTYGGNSGSAVFNANTGEVVGVLVRGERDFTYDSRRGCSVSNTCADNACRGEDVTFISYVIEALK